MARLLASFALLFAVYQAAEYLQTQVSSPSPIGPALMVVTVLIAWPLGRWLDGTGFAAFGLDRSVASLRWLAAGFILAIIAKLASLAIGLGLGAVTLDSTASALPLSAVVGAVTVAAVTTFIPSLAEDILTRGLPLRINWVARSMPLYLGVTAALYTANHLWRFGWGPTEQLRLFCLGLAYAAGAWKARSLWGAVALHWGWNFAGTISDMIVPVSLVDENGSRLVSAAIHIALLATVLMLPITHDGKPRVNH